MKNILSKIKTIGNSEYMKSILIKIAERFGYRYIINIYYILENKIYLKQLRKIETKNERHFVVFHGVRTFPSVATPYIEAIIGHSLRLRGAKVASLICGGYFSECDADSYFDKPEKYCSTCNFGRRAFTDSLGINVLEYAKYINIEAISRVDQILQKVKSDIEQNGVEKYKKFDYKGVNVGYSAWASLIRYYQTISYPKDQNASSRYISYLRRCMLLVEIGAEFLQRERPTIMITLHGIYATWEPLYRYMSQNGVVVYMYEFCMADIHGVRFVKNARNNEYLNQSMWRELQLAEVPEREAREYEEFLSQRFAFKRGYVTVLTNGVVLNQSNKDQYLEFVKKPCKHRCVMFTNIPWDAALINADTIFEDIFEWFDGTLQFFINNSEYHLIIKVHPAEWLEKTSYTFSDYLADKYPELPKNIFVVTNTSKLRPYEIFEDVDLGIVFNGTIGLEMAIKGKAVIAGGATHYTRAGNVVYDIRTKEQYFEAIRDPEEIKKFALENIKNAYKYGYLFFRKCELPLPILYENKYVELNRRALKKSAEFVKFDPYLNAIACQILNEEEVVRPENWLDYFPLEHRQ